MADNTSYLVPALVMRVPDGASFITSAVSSHTTTLSFDGHVFSPAVEIDYSKMGNISADLGTASSKISKIPADIDGSLFSNIYDRIRYGQVECFVYEIEVDIETDAVISGRLVLKGLLYKASSHISSRILDIEIKEDKYYYDKIGGVTCSEQCAAAYFGDKICKKAVTFVIGNVLSVSRTVLTLTATPAGVNFIYNNGYIEFEGLRIKTAYWESGAVFSMSDIAPASWVGENVSVFIGCDKTIQSCRDIHNNVSEFFGLGHSMVDYNALFENA